MLIISFHFFYIKLYGLLIYIIPNNFIYYNLNLHRVDERPGPSDLDAPGSDDSEEYLYDVGLANEGGEDHIPDKVIINEENVHEVDGAVAQDPLLFENVLVIEGETEKSPADEVKAEAEGEDHDPDEAIINEKNVHEADAIAHVPLLLENEIGETQPIPAEEVKVDTLKSYMQIESLNETGDSDCIVTAEYVLQNVTLEEELSENIPAEEIYLEEEFLDGEFLDE